ncbi:Os11g0463200 [Oryza sativa Japonica Group]|uniref:Os11g0463200 protein n=4 Tax=Oryza TaxID=4527 RepID=Q2R4S4_ORYSJ|nr:hypothetical protein LOC_Os11g27480 [Oryza sativa Japonica Group]EAZ18299.1 hypothetical protein OsJ_33836 [Oryza sativa Japonica Group]BAT13963.1 Os11g0463200 [Oryza sativa Japonica Group]
MGVGERLTRGRWWGQKAAKWMEHALPRVLGRKDNVFHHECTCIENIRMPAVPYIEDADAGVLQDHVEDHDDALPPDLSGQIVDEQE